MTTFRPGVRLAVDWGDARIGVAACDADGVLAYPLTTVAAGATEIADLARLIAEHRPIEVWSACPGRCRGPRDRRPSRPGTEHSGWLARSTTPVRLVDERLTTVTARSAAPRERQAGPAAAPADRLRSRGGHPRAGARGRTFRRKRRPGS